MSTRPTKTPSIPAPTADNLLEVAKAVKILLDIREGRLGDPRDAFLTVRDASSASGFQLSLLGGGGGGGGGGSGPGDTTPPAAPTGLTAVGAFALIVLQWSSPATPNNIAYAEVWRSDTDVLGSAVMIGTSASRFYTDSVGASRGYYYWIRFVSRANVAGPYNDTSGTFGQTATDPQVVLDVLNAALRESHLYRGLTEPISSIISGQDAAAEAALAASLEARSRARRSAESILELAAQRGTDITELRRIIAAGDEQLSSLITTLTARVETNRSEALAAIEEESTTRSSADTAEALQRTTLAAQLRGSYEGSDINAVSTGLVGLERLARVSEDQALASRIETLESEVNDPVTGNTGLATAISNLSTRVTTAEGDIDATSNSLTLLESRVSDAESDISGQATALSNLQTQVTLIDGELTSTASDVTTLFTKIDSPTIGNNPTYAALQTEASVRASETGALFGQYTVKVDLNGYVTGYGLASTVVDGVPTSEFIVVADRFAIAPVATSPSAADGAPFFVITSPTTIDGVLVAPGVYLKSAFIADATIGTAKIRSIAADKIVAGYTASVDLESSVFVGSEFYIGGTVTYEFNDPTRPEQRTGIASVSNPNVAFNSLGASFNVNFFRVFNGTTFETPFEISGGLVRAKRAEIQDLQVTSAKIADMIRSNNWNGVYVDGSPSADPHYDATSLILNFDASSTVDQSPLANAPSDIAGVTYQDIGSLAGAFSLVSAFGSRMVYGASTAFNQRAVYTLEFRLRWSPGSPQGYFMSRGPGQYFAINTDGNIVVVGYGATLVAPLSSGVNHHIELTSDGSTLRLFRDGTLFDSGVAAAENLAAQQFAVLGVPGRPDLGGPACVLDAVRLTQGVARHTAPFTPPAGALPGGPIAGGFTSFGTAGWAISKGGDVVINSLYSRGSIAGGGFSPASWAWPISGSGFYVGPEGIRLGREASGQFFEASVSGAIRAPGLSISGGVLTLGGASGQAVLQSAAGNAFINLGAVGDQPFLYTSDVAPPPGFVGPPSPGAGPYSIIYANGRALFSNVVTQGTWNGDVHLVVFSGGFPPTAQEIEAVIDIDTGVRVPLSDTSSQGYSSRTGGVRTISTGQSAVTGNLQSILMLESSVVVATPTVYGPPGTSFNAGQNPYGGSNAAVFIRVRVKILDGYNPGFTTFRVTQLDWVLDRIA